MLVAALMAAGCGGAPGATPDAGTVRDAFAEQLASSGFVREVQRSGDELEFLGPDGAGGEARWRVRIESVVVEPSGDDATPFRGLVSSSWYVNDRQVQASGAESYLPVEFLSRGLAQECWALWDVAGGRWTW